jgi:Zn-dependent peptidase ImmA (M78 family)/transcriptional regulator with XRE-family HTH domain
LREHRFEPGRLTLARELLELSQAQLASRAGLSAAAIGQFESGVTTPTAKTIETLSGVLDTPADFFTLAFADATHEGFFRSLRRTSISHRRHARAVAHVAHDLATEAHLGEAQIPAIPVTDLTASQAAVEAVAMRVRELWHLPAGPIANVVGLLESHGVVVIRMPMDTADVDAFSLPFEDRPVIVLGSDKADRARSRFDAAHELGHLVMHGNQIWGVKEVEQQAHWFAASFLMPADQIGQQLPSTLDWPAFFALKKTWQVSLAALLMRAKALGRMSDQQYLSAMKATSARGWRRIEPVPLGPPERPQEFQRLLTSPEIAPFASALPRRVLRSLQEEAAP